MKNTIPTRTLKSPFVVNLYGGPGTGKSTTAASLFALLKQEGVNCELVTEYAKDCVWDEHYSVFNDQIYIFGHMHHRLQRLIGKVDVILTDGPLLLCNYYRSDKSSAKFKELVLETHRSFDNLEVFLRRVKPYNPAGRMQTEDQAKDIDKELKDMLIQYDLKLYELDADKFAAGRLLPDILFLLEQKKVAWEIQDDPYEDGK